MIEADVRYPTDAGLTSSGVLVLAPEGLKLAKPIGEGSDAFRVELGEAVRLSTSCRTRPHEIDDVCADLRRTQDNGAARRRESVLAMSV